MVITRNTHQQLLALVVLLIVSGNLFAASIEARLDRYIIHEGETVTLRLDVTGSGRPDLAPLEKDFEIHGRNKSSSVQIINGKMSSKTQWVLSLMPKRLGKLTIPALPYGQISSKPLTVEVKPARTSQGGATAEDVFMQVQVNPSSAYVQSQIIYTVRIYVGVRMNNASLSELKLSDADAVVEKLGDAKQYETTHLGRRYQVLEQSYAIFPQQSGKLHIEPLVFSGRVLSNRSMYQDPFNQFGKDKRLRSKAIDIDIKPVPKGQQARSWLPAKEVQLKEQWPDTTPRFKAGEAVTRTLMLTAEGLTAAQLPEIKQHLPAGFKVYPDQAKLDNKKLPHTIIGQRIEKTALIATTPGKHTLPEIKIKWWNTETNKPAFARVPARQIVVLPAEGSQNSLPTNTTGNKNSSPSILSEQNGQTDNSSQTETTSSRDLPLQAGYWPWISLLFCLGWLATLFLWWYKKRKAQFMDTQQHAEVVKRKQLSLRQAEKNIQRACENNDVNACKQALLHWATLYYPHTDITSLTALLNVLGLTPDSELKTHITKLNEVLYNKTDAPWQGDGFWQAWQKMDKQSANTQSSNAPGLAPLYPEQV